MPPQANRVRVTSLIFMRGMMRHSATNCHLRGGPAVGYRINHIHLKASDPRKTADWYVKAFDFTIVSDTTRVFGDRFIRCQSADGGIAVNISGARTGETLGAGDASTHHGLEHYGFDSADLEMD